MCRLCVCFPYEYCHQFYKRVYRGEKKKSFFKWLKTLKQQDVVSYAESERVHNLIPVVIENCFNQPLDTNTGAAAV